MSKLSTESAVSLMCIAIVTGAIMISMSLFFSKTSLKVDTSMWQLVEPLEDIAEKLTPPPPAEGVSKDHLVNICFTLIWGSTEYMDQTEHIRYYSDWIPDEPSKRIKKVTEDCQRYFPNMSKS